MIGSRRLAMAAERRSQVAASRSATSVEPSAAPMPPARSISWNHSQALEARSSVSRSTYQEPPAGSITRATPASSTSSDWVLRAMRRAKASGRPRRASKGWTVTASAPPVPAAKQASVVRSMFTHGSRAVIMAEPVTACCRCPPSGAPHTSVTRAQSRRAARSLAMVRN